MRAVRHGGILSHTKQFRGFTEDVIRRAVALSAVLSLVLVAAPVAAEGFGFSKRAVKLDRPVPPEVVMLGTSLEVAVADHGGYEPAARKLRDALEKKMTSHDGRLQVGQPGDIKVELRVDEVRVDESWKQKTEYESRQVGTKIETDSKGNKKEKPVYESFPVDVNWKNVSGKLVARTVVLDPQGNEVHSETSEASYGKEFKRGEGAPSRSGLEDTLIEEVASKISGKLVGRIHPVSVLVPRGSFDKLVPIAEAGKWEQYRQQVEAVPAKKKPQDEAFRQYALGVANEGLAYKAESEEASIELLQKAETHYRQAISMNPREELFAKAYSNVWSGGYAHAPVQRVESARADYQKLKEQRLALAAGGARLSRPAVAAVAAIARTTGAKSAKKKVLDNSTVVDMAKAGLSDENIKLAIDSADSTEFDLAPDSLIAMAKAGVSRDVLAHMQRKQR